MEQLTKDETNTLIFALEDLMRNPDLEQSRIKEIAELRSKLCVIYTSLKRSESKKTMCPVCGGELIA